MATELFSEVQAGELEGYERQRSRARAGAVLSAVQLYGDVKSGRVPWYLLSEAIQPRTPAIAGLIARNYPGLINMRETMTRSDFPLLMGDMIERVMLARWGAFPQAWRSFVGVGTRRDFRTGRSIAVDGLEGAFPEQMEEEELQYGALTEAGYTYGIKKYSLGAKVSWELVLNDDLNAFDTIPDRLGRGGARTVARFVTSLYAAATGPNATFFSAGNGNLIPAGAASALSITSLATAFTMLRTKTDSQGEPIIIESAVLVVPPALEVTARNLMNTTAIVPVSTTGGPVYSNWIMQNLMLAVDPYLPIVTTTGTIGATEWFLFASPAVARPADRGLLPFRL